MAELQEMIQRLKKDLISSSSPLSPVEQHALRRKIVHLQLQLQSKKEVESIMYVRKKEETGEITSRQGEKEEGVPKIWGGGGGGGGGQGVPL